jgi:hypothetical protein
MTKAPFLVCTSVLALFAAACSDSSATVTAQGDGAASDAPQGTDSAGGDAANDVSTGDAGDAGATDASDAAVVQPNVVFVTSQTFNGNLGGIAGADAKCQAAAQAASLKGTFIAYVATSSASAASRVASARGWVRTDGQPVADLPAQLAAGHLWYPIALDENGKMVTGRQVETGANKDGSYYTNGSCKDWTSASNADMATAGDAYAGSAEFQTIYGPQCDVVSHLYCLQATQVVTVALPKVSGRHAFTTATGWQPNSGLAGADAKCATEAQLAGLAGTYKALLATSQASAASRFNTNGPTWVRPDGVPIFAQASDLGTFKVLAPVVVAANGTTYKPAYVWVGASDVASTGVLANTCQDWTVNWANQHGLTGPNLFIGGFGGFSPTTCDLANYELLCFEP